MIRKRLSASTALAEQLRPYWKAGAAILGLGVLGLIFIWAINQGYSDGNAGWTGFGPSTTPSGGFAQGKQLWDWLELLIIPLFLVLAAFILVHSGRESERRSTEARSKLERDLAVERQQEASLQSYLDRMAELLLKEKLKLPGSDEAREVARIRTLTVLRTLDGKRKGLVLRFLYDAGLIIRGPNIVELRGADLQEVDLMGAGLSGAVLVRSDLRKARLREANLNHVILRRADLRGADLSEADLSAADLREADLEAAELHGADLRGADLREAVLRGAYLFEADLRGASLRGADLSGADPSGAVLDATTRFDDTTKWPHGFPVRKTGVTFVEE